MPPTATTVDDAPWRAGLHSARALRGPGLVVIAVAASVVVAYYSHAPTHAALERLAAFRTRGGYVFSAMANLVFGGLLPFLILRLNSATRPVHPWRHLLFFAAYPAWKGVEVDLLYRFQAVLFGGTNDWLVVLKKMLVDQLVYTPLTVSYAVVLYAWKDAGFRAAAPLADLRAGRWFARRVFPVLLAVWCVWVPTVCCIYALPLALQFPLNCAINFLWMTLFSLITVRQNHGP